MKIWIKKHTTIAVTTLYFENLPLQWIKCLKDKDTMANSVDPDQTAQKSSLIWVCTCLPIPVCVKTLGSIGCQFMGK